MSLQPSGKCESPKPGKSGTSTRQQTVSMRKVIEHMYLTPTMRGRALKLFSVAFMNCKQAARCPNIMTYAAGDLSGKTDYGNDLVSAAIELHLPAYIGTLDSKILMLDICTRIGPRFQKPKHFLRLARTVHSLLEASPLHRDVTDGDLPLHLRYRTAHLLLVAAENPELLKDEEVAGICRKCITANDKAVMFATIMCNVAGAAHYATSVALSYDRQLDQQRQAAAGAIAEVPKAVDKEGKKARCTVADANKRLAEATKRAVDVEKKAAEAERKAAEAEKRAADAEKKVADADKKRIAFLRCLEDLKATNAKLAEESSKLRLDLDCARADRGALTEALAAARKEADEARAGVDGARERAEEQRRCAAEGLALALEEVSVLEARAQEAVEKASALHAKRAAAVAEETLAAIDVSQAADEVKEKKAALAALRAKGNEAANRLRELEGLHGEYIERIADKQRQIDNARCLEGKVDKTMHHLRESMRIAEVWARQVMSYAACIKPMEA